MNIIYDDEIEIKKDMLDILKKAAEICALREKLNPEVCEVSMSVVDEDTIRELNANYRDKDSVTDVLSFPQFDDFENMVQQNEICLGDVIICNSIAIKQAEEYGHSYKREFVYLFVHSMLHLLGYDHMEEEGKAVMRRLEEETMEQLGLVR
ncbi:MAG: rRNA maturation RNase YbeY [Firmicutes bacterium]|nr:rRNA maturation RNase YbeY [Bacillota bacterium]